MTFEKQPRDKSGSRRITDLCPGLKLMFNPLPILIGEEGMAPKDFLVAKHRAKKPGKSLESVCSPP
ncbi:MAG: hypothetical protein WCJ07_13245 [Verrucomicrobiota bacterium]